MIRKFTRCCAVIVLLLIPSFFSPSPALALSGSNFNPGRIIDDNIFTNKSFLTVVEIQNFLNSKVVSCNTNHAPTNSTDKPPYTCLKDYYQNTTSGVDNYGGKPIPAGAKSAARIIYDAAQLYSINPAVLLVTLQKENSLITDDWPWKVQYRTATGFACPDSSPCDPEYFGFYKQVNQAARHFRNYFDVNPNWTVPYTPGQRYVSYNPNSTCGGTSVNIQNRATAALYSYTPYQPNAAALANLKGSGDSCSAYGNRNFWRLYNEWFGSTTQSALFKLSTSSTYYLEWGDFYYPIPSEDMLKAYGLQNAAPRVVNQFPATKTKGPALQRAAKFGSDNPSDPDYTPGVHIIDGGKRYGAQNYGTLSAHGYPTWENYDPNLAYLLDQGQVLTNMVRKNNGAIFLFEQNKRRGFPDGESYSALSGPDYLGVVKPYSTQALVNLSDEYVDSKVDGTPMLLDGKFITTKDSPAIYLYDNNQKYLFSPESFSNWGGKIDYSFLTHASLSQIPVVISAPQLVKSSGGQKYIVDNGTKKSIAESTEQDWNFADNQFTEVTSRALGRLKNDTLGILIKDSRPGIYIVQNGERHGITSLEDFSGLNLKWGDVQTLSTNNFSLVPRGANAYVPTKLVRTPNGAVLVVGKGYKSYGVTSGSLFTNFGFKWASVRATEPTGLSGYQNIDLQALLKDDENNQFYLIDSGIKRAFNTDLQSNSKYKISSSSFLTIDHKILEQIKNGSSLTQFLKGSGSTFYFIQNGLRRPVSSEESFYSVGGSWSEVTPVSDSFLNTIPKGAIL